jgi:glycosyltransferase involved in cell wall biosynthesis
MMGTGGGRPLRSLQIVGDSAWGGGGYLLERWCDWLVARGQPTEALATDPVVVDALRRIPGLVVHDDIVIPREIRPGADARAAARLWTLLRARRYDVVHTYTATPGFLGRLVGRVAGVPFVTHHQAGWPATDFSPAVTRALYRPLEYLAVSASHASICVSHATRTQGLAWGMAPASRLVVVQNGIDAAPFGRCREPAVRAEARIALGVPEGVLTIGVTGRLADQKDPLTVLRAVPALRAALGARPFVVLVAGTGPLEAACQAMVARLGIGDVVRLLGFRRDIPTVLAASDLYTSPSLWEGLSIALLEAMAAACPIVTTTILPNAELVADGATGLLVPPRDPAALAGALARLAADHALAERLGAAARARVLERFTLERMFDETWAVYARGVGRTDAAAPTPVAVGAAG